MDLKHYIVQYRRMSVEEFAIKLGVSSSTLWQYFSGVRRPTHKRAEKIQKLTDGLVTVKDLRGEDQKMKGDL